MLKSILKNLYINKSSQKLNEFLNKEFKKYNNSQKFLNEGFKNYINYQNNLGETPLHIYCKLGKFETVKKIIGMGADVNIHNNEGLTPIEVAIEEKKKHIVNYLLNYNKTIINFEPDNDGNNIFHKFSKFEDIIGAHFLGRIRSNVEDNIYYYNSSNFILKKKIKRLSS